MIVEGVALLPSLVGRNFIKEYKINFFCVGNTHFENFLDFSWKHRIVGDWLSDYDKKTFKKVIKFCTEFSKVFKKEAEELSIPYFDIDSKHFQKDIEKIAKSIVKSVQK